jgi:hypothetical protein
MRYRVDRDSWLEADSFSLVTLKPDGIEVRIGDKYAKTFAFGSLEPAVCEADARIGYAARAPSVPFAR